MYSMPTATVSPSGILCAVTQRSNERPGVTPAVPCSASSAGRPSKLRTPSSQRADQLGMRLQPCRGRHLRLLVLVEDGVHHLGLAARRELEILEQPAHVRALAQ